MLLTTLCSLAVVQGPGQNLTATVDDAVSPGALGDAHLSLAEAIRLANGTLGLASLSTAERAQVTGSGTMVDTIVVDGAMVPTITLAQQLPDVTGMGMMMPIWIQGMPGPNGMPTLAAGAVTYAFGLRQHDVTVEGFRIVGGAIAIDARMPFAVMPMMGMPTVMDCEFENQTAYGIRLWGGGNDQSMLMVMGCSFRNQPIGIYVDDQTINTGLMAEGDFLDFDGVGIGCDVNENGLGGLTMCMLFRSDFRNGQTLARKRRSPFSTSQFMYRFTHVDAQCDGDVVDVQGNAGGLTMVHHHHSDFVAGATHKAFHCWPRTAEFDIHGSEMRFVGDVLVSGNPFTMRVWQQNNRYENGVVTFDVDGALPNLLWNRYTNCSVVVPTTARSPVTVRQSEFVQTTVDSQSLFAPVQLQGCWRQGGGLTGQASETSPAPAAFLGSATVTPEEPQLGTNLRLTTDLPAGIAAVWDFAFSDPRPVTTVEPVRFYGDLATAVVMPGLFTFQSAVDVPLPNAPWLVGYEFYVQPVAIPLYGQAYAPSFHLPRGGLMRPRP